MTKEDWKKVSTILFFLSVFYDVNLRFSASHYITCDSYTHDFLGLARLLLANNVDVDDEGMRKMAANMINKYKNIMQTLMILIF